MKSSPAKRVFSRRKQLETDLEHVTQEMYRRNKELAETNRTLSMLRAIDDLVLKSHESLASLCGQLANSIVSTTEYPFVAFLGPTKSRSGLLEVYGWKAHDAISVNQGLFGDIRPTTRHNWFRGGAKDAFISLLHLNANEAAGYLGITQAAVEKIRDGLPLKSIYVVKLQARDKLVGVMLVGSVLPVADFRDAEANLLDRLSEALGIALDNRLLFEENQEILKQLQKTNAKLRELDKTKDEFISMASHQLRTPLTAVKGYLSMILEGDTGKVSKSQQEYTQKAFDGAQKMVYLIADMLNVSRLQSGKFVIENKPTDLAQLVEGEVSQLATTAAEHKIKLDFHKPDKLPVLNLDETKIRQVVMNFTDNALYYTPAGGSVTVELSASDKEVIFTVTDTGLGVPASVQHHLFSKFYRADNARKVRPDGTGLGLFMAKKVIVAQGGAIIFKSVEGKGSNFGFSFPRSTTENKGGTVEKTPQKQPVAKKSK